MSSGKQILAIDWQERQKAVSWAGKLLLSLFLMMVPLIVVFILWKSKRVVPAVKKGAEINYIISKWHKR